jgi:hypothetical protein
MRKLLAVAAMSTVAAMATPAVAADTLWLDSDHTSYGGYYSTGQSLLFSSAGVNVRASAWSIDSGGTINAAQLGIWDQGMGVRNGTGDNSHTVDNSGWTDFILLQFDQVVELSYAQFNTGWHGLSDTDATIGYLANLGIPFGSAPALDGLPEGVLSVMNLYESGSWGNSGNSWRDINPGDNTGNLWLIGASFNNPEGSYKLDGFKLEKLKFEATPAVPEPATWLMMILGFGLVGGVMRSQRRQKLTVSYS